MKRMTRLSQWCSLALLSVLLVAVNAASAADVRVVSSGGFAAAYRLLGPEHERRSGDRLVTAWGPSMGQTPEAIPNRMARGEPIDVVIMVDGALNALIKQGKVVPDSKRILAASKIAMAVRGGAAKPDISTVDALRQTLLNAKSIAYSDSASGVYLSSVLFPRLGIADQIKGKSRMIPAEPVGQVIARGDAEIGFQQLSELLPVAGLEIVGLLPGDAQTVTLFSAGVVTDSKEARAARALVEFLASPAAAAAIGQTGLEPGSNAKH